MLLEYFSITINDGFIESIPILLQNHVPDTDGLPLFLLRLGTEVDWDEEKQCLHGILQEIALFYAVSDKQTSDRQEMTQHILFPAFKKHLLPGRGLRESIVQIADLPDLYKVFERC
jgi:DNA mismatch repair protein MLH1